MQSPSARELGNTAWRSGVCEKRLLGAVIVCSSRAPRRRIKFVKIVHASACRKNWMRLQLLHGESAGKVALRLSAATGAFVPFCIYQDTETQSAQRRSGPGQATEFNMMGK